eukprot:4532747-Alexandrium_andersonii.AAC.1
MGSPPTSRQAVSESSAMAMSLASRESSEQSFASQSRASALTQCAWRSSLRNPSRRTRRRFRMVSPRVCSQRRNGSRAPTTSSS